MRRRQRRSDCPVHFALEVFGDPWSLLIIRDLMFKGRTRYTDFMNAEEGIATNVLADRLARLEQDGIVEKEPTVRGASGSYRLTPKGVDLLPLMIEIVAWSAKYDPRTAADREFVRRVRKDRDGLLAELRAQLSSLARGPKPARDDRAPRAAAKPSTADASSRDGMAPSTRRER
jgi:DNA-binding HxlR family transcriptional regulator